LSLFAWATQGDHCHAGSNDSLSGSLQAAEDPRALSPVGSAQQAPDLPGLPQECLLSHSGARAQTARRRLAPIGATIVSQGDRGRQGCMNKLAWDESDPLGLAGFTASKMLEAGLSIDEGLDLIGKALVVRALEANRGNIVHAGRQIGRHRNSMARLIREFAIEDLPRKLRNAHNQASLKFPRQIEWMERRRRSVA
jgi:transcriptional regulator of acetoin/glycerol metabolism